MQWKKAAGTHRLIFRGNPFSCWTPPNMDEETVAEQIEKIHMEYTPVIQYNNANSQQHFDHRLFKRHAVLFKPIRELPAERSFDDFIFLPKPEHIGIYPALLAELKWNKSAATAIAQTKEKQHPSARSQYTGDILLIGINYDKKSKTHQCVIEKFGQRISNCENKN